MTTESPFVVSANYFDRDSENKWLLRRKQQHHEDSKPVKHLIAQGVNFEKSDQYEQGWGCSVVAKCAFTIEVKEGDPEISLDSYERIKFDGFDGFYLARNRYRKVRSARELVLLPDGSMYAKL